MTTDKNITSVLKETRLFPPPAGFADKAHVGEAERDRLREELRVLRETSAPDARQYDAIFRRYLDSLDAFRAAWEAKGTTTLRQEAESKAVRELARCAVEVFLSARGVGTLAGALDRFYVLKGGER